MFIGKIVGGCWIEGQLFIGEMPKEFVLSARSVCVLELDEYEKLESLCRNLAEACNDCISLLRTLEGSWENEDGQISFQIAEIDAVLSDAKKAGIINGDRTEDGQGTDGARRPSSSL